MSATQKKEVVYTGTIGAFQGSWQSGLASLIVNGLGIPCENTTTVRALEGCYGDVITDSHSVDNAAIKGKRIAFSLDNMGMLDGFTPENEFDAEAHNVKLVEWGME